MTGSPRPPDDPVWRQALHTGDRLPHTSPAEEVRWGLDLPRTLLPAPDGLDQPAVFDPALLQHAYAFRAGDPRFADEAQARTWFRARRTALDLVLSAVADSPHAGRLVLRGSALMATWFGDAAREPGDLDFVAPYEWDAEGPEAQALFPEIASAAQAAAQAWQDGAVRIDAAGAVTEDIWTYDRVPGRRMLLPWTAADTVGGTVQLDVVYGELLADPAVPTTLHPLGDGPAATLPAVTPELSLAWKVMWLINDMHPQGKDLYDAVLLAGRAVPAYDMLRSAFVLAGDELLRPGGRWWLDEIAAYTDVGWEHFQREYPQVTGTAQEYVARLAAALDPLVSRAERDAEAPAYDRWARWLVPLVERVGASDPIAPAAAVGHLSSAGLVGLRAAVVTVREVLGRDAVTPAQALTAVVEADERWSYWRPHAQSGADLLGGVPD
ncbi:nucleotidyl transferase AbiEii/AbiGii toxin family protein [Streptomyces sp. NPDC056002]|uniref:nucleotidyl transferase AbiEii/AbiGii toxin family protein n=1 Tax=Streptomyces sp. NPDC056002 TaxID=3345675 RepID=UPI0035E260C0